MPNLPFEHLNLCRNPFGNLPESARAAVALVDVERYRRLLRGGGVAVELIGESGRGKTTHLLALAAELDGAAYVEVGPDGASSDLSEAPVVLVDEYQFLRAEDRSSVHEAADALVVAAHESHRDELESFGWTVQTVDVGRERVPIEVFARRRIEWARRGRGAVPELSPDAAEWLREEYGADMRAVENHLYDVFQALEEPRTVGVNDLENVETRPRRSEALLSASDREEGVLG